MNNPITSTLNNDQQAVAGKALQETVVDMIDLSLIAKQAHWNVVGQQFRSVHSVWAPFGWDPEYAARVGAEVVVCEMAERFVPRPPEERVDVASLMAEATAG